MKDSSNHPVGWAPGGMGSCLNLDLCNGSRAVLERLKGVNPGSITTVSVEYNLMAEIVFDQEWMDIMEAIGSLPFINTVSLSFRVPVPLPMEAFTKLIDEAVSLETLNLVGLQLSEKRLSFRRSKEESSPVDAMIRAFRESEDLHNIQLSRYRPSKSSSTTIHQIDPLILALTKLPRCKVFHVDRTDVFSDPSIRDMILRAPFHTFKIGNLGRTTKLQDHFLPMAVPISENSKLKELVIQEMMTDESLLVLSELLQQNNSLTSLAILRVQSNNFGNLLGSALEENTTLENLEINVVLRDRAVFRQNVRMLASSLGTNGHFSSLKTLKLNAQGVRSSCLLTDPFLKALKNDNFVLQNLLINRNTVPLGEEISFYLRVNKIGRNYFLRRPEEVGNGRAGLLATRKMSFREEWAHMLIENKKDVRVLHYFLSLNPTILPQP